MDRGADEPLGDPEGWVEGLPTSAHDQTCAVCSGRPVWVHRLDPAQVTFRVYGKGHTLPTFWTICDRCDELYAAGDDEALVALMIGSDGWPHPDEPSPFGSRADLDETIRQPLAVFRRADLGRRRLLD